MPRTGISASLIQGTLHTLYTEKLVVWRRASIPLHAPQWCPILLYNIDVVPQIRPNKAGAWYTVAVPRSGFGWIVWFD